MVLRCIAPKCGSHGRTYSKEDREKNRLSFHRLPLKSPVLLAQWMQNMGDHGTITWRSRHLPLEKKKPKYWRVCSLHFTTSCYEASSSNSRQLKSNAVPTMFDYFEIYSQMCETAKNHAKISAQHDHTYPLGDANTVKLRLHELQDRLQTVQKSTSKSNAARDFSRLQRQLAATRQQLVTAERKVKRLEYLQKLLRLEDTGGADDSSVVEVTVGTSGRTGKNDTGLSDTRRRSSGVGTSDKSQVGGNDENTSPSSSSELQGLAGILGVDSEALEMLCE